MGRVAFDQFLWEEKVFSGCSRQAMMWLDWETVGFIRKFRDLQAHYWNSVAATAMGARGTFPGAVEARHRLSTSM